MHVCLSHYKKKKEKNNKTTFSTAIKPKRRKKKRKKNWQAAQLHLVAKKVKRKYENILYVKVVV